MLRYIAFLRAINISNRFVKMDRLRALFAELEFANVATFIASGNVIFEAEATERRELEAVIEQQLRRGLGFAVATFVRTPDELAGIAAHQAFPAPDITARVTQHVAFLGTPPSEHHVRALMNFRTALDDFHVREREVYWLCRTPASQSPFSGAVLEKTLGQPATLRNITTVRRLVAKYAPAPE